MNRIVWVIGRGGFIGSAVSRKLLQKGIFQIETDYPLQWPTTKSPHDLDRYVNSLDASIASINTNFSRDGLSIIWCAGRSFPHSSNETVEIDQLVLELFLQRIRLTYKGNDVHFVFASSAGGLYSTECDAPFGATSPIAPITAYGTMKLKSETAVLRFADETGGRPSICRISNVYGPGQNLSKSQGLMAKLAISSVTKVPVNIFVPLSTTRNYIYIDDAAEQIINIVSTTTHGKTLEIISSPDNLAISRVISECKRVFPRAPIVTFSDFGRHENYVSNLSMKSNSIGLDYHTPISLGLLRLWTDILTRRCTPWEENTDLSQFN